MFPPWLTKKSLFFATTLLKKSSFWLAMWTVQSKSIKNLLFNTPLSSKFPFVFPFPKQHTLYFLDCFLVSLMLNYYVQCLLVMHLLSFVTSYRASTINIAFVTFISSSLILIIKSLFNLTVIGSEGSTFLCEHLYYIHSILIHDWLLKRLSVLKYDYNLNLFEIALVFHFPKKLIFSFFISYFAWR